jgi:hypothetical protein
LLHRLKKHLKGQSQAPILFFKISINNNFPTGNCSQNMF